MGGFAKAETVEAKLEGTAPTCTEGGSGSYTATFTDQDFVTQTTPAEEREPLGHELTAHEATDADCTKAGNTAYWSCDRCGKFFEDAEGDSEIEEGSWIIPALEHDLTYHAAVTATCADGNKEYWECENCGKYFADENATRELRWNEIVLPATGNHVWGEGEVTKEPTCTEKGVKTYTCTVCGETKTEDVAMQ